MQNIAEGRKIRWILLAFRDEIRYNKVNHMYYIYVRMRNKDFTEKKNVRRNI